VFGSCRDITDRRTMMASLAQADRMSSMGLLAAGVAHEINNPLAYVLHNLETLAVDLAELADRGGGVHEGELDELRQRAELALDGTQRISGIARGLGRFSRVDIGELEPVDVRQVIENALSIAANETRFRARVVRELDKVPDVLASEGRLAQVFLNLLVNAAHAIEEGDIEGNEIRVRTWAAGGQVYVSVRDTGCGIDEDHMQRLFDPFFTTKELGAGSGLGLSISRTIVENYGGVITVDSRPGEGTMITVKLPATAEARKPAPPAPPARVEVTGRVLIIDDEEPLRRITERMLSNHVTACAGSGNQARRILESDNGFDVILCDLMMPDGSGMELHQWLAEHHPELANRVIFVTGGVFTPRSREYVARLGSPVLEKPYARSQLLQAVHAVMAASGED
jgi:nitrogen-specific signal transduction histidine kinase/CheY-like chemotaxis protein